MLSRAEQAKAPKYLSDAANALRAAKPNARITCSDAMEAFVAARASQLIGAVNQTAGSGVATLSKAEAAAAAKREPNLGFAVMEAYQIVSGTGVNVDGIAQKLASQVDDETVFKTFATEAEAERFRDRERHARLVAGEDERRPALGQLRLGQERPLVAALRRRHKCTGAVTVTHEHDQQHAGVRPAGAHRVTASGAVQPRPRALSLPPERCDEGSQRCGHLPGGLEPLRRVLRERLANDQRAAAGIPHRS